MKLALYRSMKYGWDSAFEFDELRDDKGDDYVRISEVTDIEFKLLPYGEAEKAQINAIDEQIKTTLAETEKKIGELKQKKAELLAIGSE